MAVSALQPFLARADTTNVPRFVVRVVLETTFTSDDPQVGMPEAVAYAIARLSPLVDDFEVRSAEVQRANMGHDPTAQE